MTSRDELLDQLGSPYTNEVVARLHRFAFVPDNMLEKLAKDALSEQWGANNFVLRKYLAVHVPWAIEQDLWGAKIRTELLNKPISRQNRVFAPHG